MEGQETNNNGLNNNNQNNNETTNQINNETEKKENSVQATNKPKIVPAYMKMKEENPDNASTSNSKKVKGKPNKVKTNKPHKKINKKLIITLVITVVLLVALSIFIYVIAQNKKYAKYLPYEETMHTYAFDIMYDNQTAATREKVTKSEAIKMAIAATLNITNTNEELIYSEGKFSNDNWVEYAERYEVISEGEINSDNADDLVTYIEFVTYLQKAKVKLLKEDLKTSAELQYKDKDKYTTEQQTYLQDLIESGVIENSKSNLKGDRKVFKGEVNEIVTKYAENNNTITLEGDKININPDKVPSNASDYPYILSNVDKKVYEKKITYMDGEDIYKTNPIETYRDKKEDYASMKKLVEEYYNKLLNVDYNTIDLNEFYDFLASYTNHVVYKEDVEEYVNYVKENKIKVSGTAKVQMPVVYYNGYYYKVRTKIELNVEESDTDENILFLDTSYSDSVKYEKGSTSFIIDASLTSFMSSDMEYIQPSAISYLKVD